MKSGEIRRSLKNSLKSNKGKVRRSPMKFNKFMNSDEILNSWSPMNSGETDEIRWSFEVQSPGVYLFFEWLLPRPQHKKPSVASAERDCVQRNTYVLTNTHARARMNRYTYCKHDSTWITLLNTQYFIMIFVQSICISPPIRASFAFQSDILVLSYSARKLDCYI